MKLSRLATVTLLPAVLIGIGLAAAQQARPVDVRPLNVRKGEVTKEQWVEMKSQAIVDSDADGTFTNATYGIEVEVTKIEEFPGGVTAYARAWKGGKQLGLGKGGTFDLERFQILDPPVLVDDPTGTVIRQRKLDNGTTVTRKMREDPKAAIREEIAFAIARTGRTDTEIVAGSVGSTTTTCRPDPSPGATVDGRTMRTGVDEVWSTIRAGAGNNSETTTTNGRFISVGASATTNSFTEISRFISTQDCSSGIGDTDVIDSATFSVYVTEKADAFAASVTLVGATPASNTTIANGDYANVGSTAFSTASAISGISTSAFADFVLNATGLAGVSKTGITALGLRIEHDRANTAPTWSDSGVSRINGDYADTADTTTDPKLVVVHSPAPAATGGRKTNRVMISM